MVKLSFDQKGKLKRAIREDTGQDLFVFDLERLADQLEVQISEQYE